MCPHTTIYVSSYYYICVLILLYMCPHTTIYVRNMLSTNPISTFGERRLKKKGTLFLNWSKENIMKNLQSYYFLKYNEMSLSFLALILNSTNSDKSYLWYIYIYREREFAAIYVRWEGIIKPKKKWFLLNLGLEIQRVAVNVSFCVCVWISF